MVIMTGNNRKLDSAIVESGSPSVRTISLYGIKSMTELVNKPLLIKSAFDGVENSTIKINNLTAVPIKVFQNRELVEPFEHWVAANQLYTAIFDGSEFAVYPYGSVYYEDVNDKDF